MVTHSSGRYTGRGPVAIPAALQDPSQDHQQADDRQDDNDDEDNETCSDRREFHTWHTTAYALSA